MSSSRSAEQQRVEEQAARIKRYCNAQASPYNTNRVILAAGASVAFWSGQFPLSLILSGGSIFNHKLALEKFNTCVKEEEKQLKITTSKP